MSGVLVIGLFGDAGNVQDQRDRHTDHQGDRQLDKPENQSSPRRSVRGSAAPAPGVPWGGAGGGKPYRFLLLACDTPLEHQAHAGSDDSRSSRRRHCPVESGTDDGKLAKEDAND